MPPSQALPTTQLLQEGHQSLTLHSLIAISEQLSRKPHVTAVLLRVWPPDDLNYRLISIQGNRGRERTVSLVTPIIQASVRSPVLQVALSFPCHWWECPKECQKGLTS